MPHPFPSPGDAPPGHPILLPVAMMGSRCTSEVPRPSPIPGDAPPGAPSLSQHWRHALPPYPCRPNASPRVPSVLSLAAETCSTVPLGCLGVSSQCLQGVLPSPAIPLSPLGFPGGNRALLQGTVSVVAWRGVALAPLLGGCTPSPKPALLLLCQEKHPHLRPGCVGTPWGGHPKVGSILAPQNLLQHPPPEPIHLKILPIPRRSLSILAVFG